MVINIKKYAFSIPNMEENESNTEVSDEDKEGEDNNDT